MSGSSDKKALYGDRDRRPVLLTPLWDQFPHGLRALDQWVGWELRWDDTRGQWAKIPLDVRSISASTGYGKAKSNNPSTWSSLDVVRSAWGKRYGTLQLPDPDGPGFVLANGILGVDLDNCRDPATGDLTPFATQLRQRVPGYYETSPSGLGIKAFFRGELPAGWTTGRKVVLPTGEELELYAFARYFATTGHRLDGATADLTTCGADGTAFLAESFASAAPRPSLVKFVLGMEASTGVAGGTGQTGLTDDEVIDKLTRTAKNAAKMAALWGGDTSANDNDDSRADQALANGIAFYTGSDPEAVDRIFRRSGLFREKWNRDDYRTDTIDKAIRGCNGQFYTGKSARKAGDGTRPTSAGKGLPKILIGPAEHEVNDQAVAALAVDPLLYQRGGELVRVIQSSASATRRLDHPAGPVIRPVSAATLRERLTAVADFRKVIKGAEEVLEVPDHPPQSCVMAVKDRGEWPGVRVLAGVADYPILRPDGTVALEEGFDAATEVFIAPYGGGVSVLSSPSRADAAAAVEQLVDVVADFPFLGEHHRAAWVASLLVALARFAFKGPAPLALIEANSPGSGKGLLANAVSVIVTGTRFAVATYSHDSAEMTKVITALAISGDRMVLLDNITGKFGNAAMDAALTSTLWRGRVLGESREVMIPLKAAWFATGNNLSLFGDMHRRVIHIRLQSPLEAPEERVGFKHPDLMGWVHENRPRLLSAALTLLAAYYRAGCPDMSLPSFGSFEDWSRTVRSAVVWAGLPDPAATRAELRENADPERAAMRCLLENWALVDPRGKGLTLARLVAVLAAAGKQAAAIPEGDHTPVEDVVDDDRPVTLDDLRIAVESIAKGLDVNALGYRFRKWKDRLIQGYTLRQTGISAGSPRWQSVHVGGGDGALGGHSPTYLPSTVPTSLFNQAFWDGSRALDNGMPTIDTIPTTSGEEGQRKSPLKKDLSV